MKVYYEQAHKWQKKENSVPLLYTGQASPFSTWQCSRCSLLFFHYYHQEPSIYQAIANAEIDGSKCEVIS